jgi:hypothetical protein
VWDLRELAALSLSLSLSPFFPSLLDHANGLVTTSMMEISAQTSDGERIASNIVVPIKHGTRMRFGDGEVFPLCLKH